VFSINEARMHSFNASKDLKLKDFTLKYFEALKVILASSFFCLSMWLFSSFSLSFPVLFSQIGYFECVMIY